MQTPNQSPLTATIRRPGPLAALALACLTGTSMPLHAQDSAAPDEPRDRRIIEEIIVSAQLRDQAVQDVPISMSVLTADFISEQGISDIRDAMMQVPNVSIQAAGFFAAPTMRGFSFNNNNKAFEPPVGIVHDGIPHTRVPYFMSALYDLNRIEVLRGPQGTLFGKNTTAGLIHMISNQPTPEFESQFTVQYGELSRRRVEAAFSGPLMDGLNIRLAGLLDQRDGFIRNTTSDVVLTAPDEFKDRDRTGVRATLQAPDIWGAQVTLSAETVSMFDGGAALELMDAGPNFIETIRKWDPNVDTKPGNYVASEDFPGFRDISIETVRAQIDYPLGDWDIVTLGAYSVLKQTLSLDTDFTPAPAIFGTGGDKSPTTHLEARLVSPTFNGLFGLNNIFGWGAGTSELLVGVTYSKREILDSFFRFGINPGPFFDLVAAAGADTVDGLDVSGLIGILPINPTDTQLEQEMMNQQFEQASRASSVYVNLKWQFFQRMGIEFGGRYTEERKSASWDLAFETPRPNLALEAIGTQEFQTRRSRSETNFQPKVSLNFTPPIEYGPIDEVNLFVHWAKGFKGGGFNAFAFREDSGEEADMLGLDEEFPNDLEFEEETGDNWGFDIKSILFGGRAQFNLSLFRQTAEDFQVLIRQNPPGTVGLGTSAVVNAPKARSQGVEADLTLRPLDWLTLIGTVGYNDTEYLDFRNNECPVGKEPTGEGSRCDASGMPFPFAPDWDSTLTVNLRSSVARIPGLGRLLRWHNVDLFAGSTVEFVGGQFLDVDLGDHPDKFQDSFTRVKINVGFARPDQGWEFRVIGENITNTVTHVRVGDIFEDVIHGSQNEPRLFYAQFRSRF